jgi:hypothetical protein
VTGTLQAPSSPGVYTLALADLAANVIRQGETGSLFWAVDEAGNGSVDDLTITVLEPFSADVGTISLSTGGTQNWSLDAGVANAGRGYWVFGSLSGTSPGLPLGSVILPLNFDAYFNFTIIHPNGGPLTNSLGSLDGAGHADAAFSLPSGSNPSLTGLTVNHAYLLGPTIDFASNAVSLTFLP